MLRTLETFERLVQFRAAQREIRERQGGRLQGESELSYRWHAALATLGRFVKGPRRPV
jgi:hypothetical protein